MAEYRAEEEARRFEGSEGFGEEANALVREKLEKDVKAYREKLIQENKKTKADVAKYKENLRNAVDLMNPDNFEEGDTPYLKDAKPLYVELFTDNKQYIGATKIDANQLRTYLLNAANTEIAKGYSDLFKQVGTALEVAGAVVSVYGLIHSLLGVAMNTKLITSMILYDSFFTVTESIACEQEESWWSLSCGFAVLGVAGLTGYTSLYKNGGYKLNNKKRFLDDWLSDEIAKKVLRPGAATLHRVRKAGVVTMKKNMTLLLEKVAKSSDDIVFAENIKALASVSKGSMLSIETKIKDMLLAQSKRSVGELSLTDIIGTLENGNVDKMLKRVNGETIANIINKASPEDQKKIRELMKEKNLEETFSLFPILPEVFEKGRITRNPTITAKGHTVTAEENMGHVFSGNIGMAVLPTVSKQVDADVKLSKFEKLKQLKYKANTIDRYNIFRDKEGAVFAFGEKGNARKFMKAGDDVLQEEKMSGTGRANESIDEAIRNLDKGDEIVSEKGVRYTVLHADGDGLFVQKDTFKVNESEYVFLKKGADGKIAGNDWIHRVHIMDDVSRKAKADVMNEYIIASKNMEENGATLMRLTTKDGALVKGGDSLWDVKGKSIEKGLSRPPGAPKSSASQTQSTTGGSQREVSVVKAERSDTVSPEQQALLDELWPDGVTGNINQGCFANCTLVSSLGGVQENERIAQRVLANLIVETGEMSVKTGFFTERKVRFWEVRPGYGKGEKTGDLYDNKVIVTQDDLDYIMEAAKDMNIIMNKAQKGDLILGAANGVVNARRKGNKQFKNNIEALEARGQNKDGETIILHTDDRNVKGAFYELGATDVEVSNFSIQEYENKMVTNSVVRIKEGQGFISKLNNAGSDRVFGLESLSSRVTTFRTKKDVAGFGARENLENIDGNLGGVSSSYLAKDVDGNDVVIYNNHAYSVRKVGENQFEVINPHNREEFRYVLSGEEIINTFSAGISATF